MEEKIIYMDYQSTTPCDKRVLDKMLPYFCEKYGNPHSVSHVKGDEANAAVEKARQQVADLIGASGSKEIIFTSGATESNNLAIQGVARYYKSKGNRIITSAIEHKCVLESCFALQKEGFEIVVLPVSSDGIVDLDCLKNAMNDETILVSIMTVNNEIGTIQPIDEISKICKRNSVLFHTDAAQAVGKIPVDASKADMISISGHKIYGPKGVGALYVSTNPRIRLTPILYGGGQERGFRSGTLPVPLCVGLGEAADIAKREMHVESSRLLGFKKDFLKIVFDNLDRVYLNGDIERTIAGCVNISFDGIEGEGIMLGMPNVCISSGSACTSALLEPSYVLKALDVREDLSHSSLRIGFGRFTTAEEVHYVAKKLVEVVQRLRSMSPVW